MHSHEPAMHVDRCTAQNRNGGVNDIRRREAVGRGALVWLGKSFELPFDQSSTTLVLHHRVSYLHVRQMANFSRQVQQWMDSLLPRNPPKTNKTNGKPPLAPSTSQTVVADEDKEQINEPKFQTLNRKQYPPSPQAQCRYSEGTCSFVHVSLTERSGSVISLGLDRLLLFLPPWRCPGEG